MSNYDSMEQSLHAATDYDYILPTAERLEASIAQGIELGKKERRRRKRRTLRRVGASIAACLLILSCAFTIRLSPAFAAFMRDIPGMETFVNLIRDSGDRSLGFALDNDFVQPLQISDEYGGVKLTVEGIIADDGRAVIFYTIDNRFNDKIVTISSPKIKDSQGNDVPAILSYYDMMRKHDAHQVASQNRGTIDIQMGNGQSLPDQILISVQLQQRGPDDSKRIMGDLFDPFATEPGTEVKADRPNDHWYTLTVPIDKTRFAGMKQEYPLNRTITIEGQRITFVKATVNPLQVLVEIAYDPNNSKQIFSAGDVRVTDENGEQWKATWSMGEASDRQTLAFESSYFRQPKRLFIEGEMFRALDKDKMDVVVDTERGKLIQAPDDTLGYVGETRYGKYKKLTFTLRVDHDKDNMVYGGVMETKFKDASGMEYTTPSIPGGEMSWSMDAGSTVQYSYTYLDDKDYEQPLTFRVSSYPNYIREPYKIRIK